MQNGTYHAAYYGPFGQGFAEFALRSGGVVGRDVGDGEYLGSYKYNAVTDAYDFDIQMRVLFANMLVSDGRVHLPGEQVPIRFSVRVADLGRPLVIQMPIGSVTVTMRRTGDLPPAMAA